MGILVFVASIFALFFLPKQFFFPFGVLYVTTGVVLVLVRGILELPSPFADDEADDDIELPTLNQDSRS